MGAMASQITSLTIVYSSVYSRRRSKKTSKLRVTGLCERNSPVTGDFPHKGPVTEKMFPFDDVIMVLGKRCQYHDVGDALVPCVASQSVAMWYWQLTLRVKQILIFQEEEFRNPKVYNVTGSCDRPPHFDQQRITSNGGDWYFPASDLNATYG